MNIKRKTILLIIYSLSVGSVLISCGGGTPVIYPHISDHAEVLRVTEVMELMSSKELPESDHQILRDSGISDTEIQFGLLAVGRDYCCGGSNETTNVILLFVPKEVVVEPGDIIEVKMGKLPKETQLGTVNIASRVREKIGEKEVPRWGVPSDRSNRPCRWVPERPYLWMRILYCDWMEEEGWIKYESLLWETWMKPQ